MLKQDISRLPKWAQERIHILERDVKHWKDEAYRVTGDNPDTDVFVGTIEKLPLPRGSNIRFYFDHCEPRHNGFYIDVRIDEHGQLSIRGSDSIMIKPEASNYAAVSRRPR